MLGQRLWRWHNILPALGKCPVFAGWLLFSIVHLLLKIYLTRQVQTENDYLSYYYIVQFKSLWHFNKNMYVDAGNVMVGLIWSVVI